MVTSPSPYQKGQLAVCTLQPGLIQPLAEAEYIINLKSWAHIKLLNPPNLYKLKLSVGEKERRETGDVDVRQETSHVGQ